MKRSYNLVAPFYDCIAKLVFGGAIANAETCLAKIISTGAKVLILGGGTGRIIEKIAEQHTGLHLVFVDSSVMMIKKAQRRNAGNNQVDFIQQDALSFETAKKFDFIITPFFLDNFSTLTVEQLIHSLAVQLNVGGKWLVADFTENNNAWQRFLLKAMYLFFRIACNIGATQLPNIAKAMQQNRFALVQQQHFANGFITVATYQHLTPLPNVQK